MLATGGQGCSFTGKFDLANFTGKFTGNYRKLPKNKKINIESHNFLLNKLVNILSFFQCISYQNCLQILRISLSKIILGIEITIFCDKNTKKVLSLH